MNALPKKLLALSTLAAALCGCGSVCDRVQDVADACGGTVNKASCEQHYASCTSDDKAIIDDLADCLTQPSVCSGGKVVDLGGALGCYAAASGISSDCQKGVSSSN
jgi:hypothetical protein